MICPETFPEELEIISETHKLKISIHLFIIFIINVYIIIFISVPVHCLKA